MNYATKMLGALVDGLIWLHSGLLGSRYSAALRDVGALINALMAVSTSFDAPTVCAPVDTDAFGRIYFF